MAERDDSLIREVNEDMQRERLQKLWEQYNGVIVAVAAAIVLGVGGFKWMENRRQATAEAAGSRYIAAIRELAPAPLAGGIIPTDKAAKTAEAEKALDAIGREGGGFGTIARFRKAAVDVTAGRTAEALSAYESLAKDRNVDLTLADFAQLQTAMLKLDTSDWTDMQNRLNDLAKDSNVWRHSARELLGLAALKAGQTETARQNFEKLVSDRATPPSIAERTRLMMAMITEAELAKASPPATLPASPTTPAVTAPAPKKN
jgi:hypothetical protein